MAADVIIPCSCADHDTDSTGFGTAEGCPKHDLVPTWKRLRKTQRSIVLGDERCGNGEGDMLADEIELIEGELADEWEITPAALRTIEHPRLP